ncbi:MAG: hypothetical protein ACFFDI_28410, partial [Promethearchaeota archaeon]
MTGESNEKQEWFQIYEFWKDVPMFLEVEEEVFKKIVLQKFREAILTTLRKGITDDFTEKYNLPRRHAMSALELLPFLREKLQYNVRLSNVYFHLEKLEKANLIRKIAKRLEGKHFVTYYGRTAKMINCHFSKDLKTYKSGYRDVFKFIEALNINSNKQKLNELIQKLWQRNQML